MRISKRKIWALASTAALSLAGLVVLLVIKSSDPTIDWKETIDRWEKVTDTGEHLFTSLAFVVAGVWAYFQYVRKREDKPRLEPTVTAQPVALADTNYLLVTVQLRNTGACDIDISQRGTGLEVTHLMPTSTPGWRPPPVQELFANHHWIEPGELISDQVLLETPQREPLLLKLQVYLYSKKHHVRWEATAIVPTLKSSDGAQSLLWRPT